MSVRNRSVWVLVPLLFATIASADPVVPGGSGQSDWLVTIDPNQPIFSESPFPPVPGADFSGQPGPGSTPAFSDAVIAPEPASTALLLLVGGTALLRRRR